MSFRSSSRHDMPIFRDLLAKHAESIELPQDVKISDGIPIRALGACVIRQSQNYTIETQFVVKNGEPMMVINPLMFPNRKKCLTITELNAMDFHGTHNSEELNSALDTLADALCQNGYGKFCGDCNMRSDEDRAIVESWFEYDSKRLMPDWFITAMEISNEMQYDCCDFSDMSLGTKWKLKMSIFISSFSQIFVPYALKLLFVLAIFCPAVLKEMNFGLVIVIYSIVGIVLLGFIVLAVISMKNSLDD